jgi:hypothetical protein
LSTNYLFSRLYRESHLVIETHEAHTVKAGGTPLKRPQHDCRRTALIVKVRNGTAWSAILPEYRLAMILRAGFQTFELRRAFELPKPLNFGSRDEAFKWVKQLGSLHPETMHRFREYLVRFSDDPECFRLTDHQAIERMAELLYSRKVVIVMQEQRAGSQGATSKAAPIPVAFPLSERTSRRPTTSSKPAPAEDSPTFDPKVDAVAQAAALVAAANEGKPFCPE